MDNATQYIVDNSGHKIFVIVPFEIWEKLNNDYSQLQKKLEVFSAISSGFKEVQSSTIVPKPGFLKGTFIMTEKFDDSLEEFIDYM